MSIKMVRNALYNISIKQMLQTILLVLHNTLYRIAKKSAMVSGYNLIVDWIFANKSGLNECIDMITAITHV